MIDSLNSLDEESRLKLINDLSDEEALVLLYDWTVWARPKQLAPDGDWDIWLVLAGRGFGKTRCGAEWVRQKAEAYPDARIALLAPTAADARDVMVEGESGIMNICPPHNMPIYEPSKRRITWPNGAMAVTYSADEPERLRGPQHTHMWADELAAWRYRDTWDMAMMGLRLGDKPQAIVTTTPKPVPLLLELMKQKNIEITRGSTFDNAANLAPQYLKQIKEKYEGTRLGRQELYAEVLEDIEGAMWNRKLIQYKALQVVQ